MKYSLVKYGLTMLFLVVLVLLGCRNYSELNYRQIKAEYAQGKAKEFVKRFGSKDGVFLCEDKNNTYYLLLNGVLLNQSQGAADFSDFQIVPKGNVLNISYKETYIKDYVNKKIDSKVLYRIKLHRNFNGVKLYKNGKETHFDSVSL